MNKFTREELKQIADTDHVQCGEASALACMALAAMDSEPVGYFRRYDPDAETLISQCSKNADDSFPLYTHAQSEPITADVERDAQRYRFLRDKDAFGDDGEPGLATWDDLIELDTNEFDAAIDARMAHPSVDFLALDNALQKHERRRCKDRNCNKQIFGYSVDGLCEDCYTAISQQPAPVVLKDHQIRELVNQLRDIAIKYHAAGQLREQIARTLRAAMLQAGISAVIPDGYVMVPKEPTQAMCAAFNDSDYGRKSLRERYVAMLAAAAHDTPALNSVQSVATVPGKWVPVSERMPETDGNYWGWWSESKRQGPVWFIKSELQAQFQSHEITHWMPLPAAPQEVKGE